MIVINPAELNKIILTLSETGYPGPYTFVVTSPYTNVESYFDLGDNMSPYPERYDEFWFYSWQAQYLKPGKYIYKINNSEVDGIESGVLVVIGQEDQDVTAPVEGGDDDYIVYNNESDDFITNE